MVDRRSARPNPQTEKCWRNSARPRTGKTKTMIVYAPTFIHCSSEKFDHLTGEGSHNHYTASPNKRTHLNNPFREVTSSPVALFCLLSEVSKFFHTVSTTRKLSANFMWSRVFWIRSPDSRQIRSTPFRTYHQRRAFSLERRRCFVVSRDKDSYSKKRYSGKKN